MTTEEYKLVLSVYTLVEVSRWRAREDLFVLPSS